MMKRISGTVTHLAIAVGTYGVIDENGNEWLPVNMPEQLKKEGKKVKLTIKEVDAMSMFMWGRPVQIVAFHT